jgi:hypothetical protein
MCGNEYVLSSQRMDKRNAVNQYYITYVHANSDRKICLPSFFCEGGEFNIRTLNKKGVKGTHPMKATMKGPSQNMGRI